VNEDQVEVAVGRRDDELFELLRIPFLDEDVAQTADDPQRAVGCRGLRARRVEQRQDLAGKGQTAEREELDEDDLRLDPAEEVEQGRPPLLFDRGPIVSSHPDRFDRLKRGIGLQRGQLDDRQMGRECWQQKRRQWPSAVDHPDVEPGQPAQDRQAAREVAQAEHRLAVEEDSPSHAILLPRVRQSRPRTDSSRLERQSSISSRRASSTGKPSLL